MNHDNHERVVEPGSEPSPEQAPLVLRVSEDVPPAPTSAASATPPRAKKPAPGLIESIGWCVFFLLVQIVALLAVVGIDLAVCTARAPDPSSFIQEQLKGFSDAAAPNAEKNAAFPAVLGYAIAWGMLIAQYCSIVVILAVVPWRVGKDWPRQLGFRKPALLHVFLVILLVPAFMTLASGIEELMKLLTGFSAPSTDKTLQGTFVAFPWFLTFLAVGLGPGLVEETWCRGFIGRGLSARYGLVVGVLVTSIFFGLLHADLAYAAIAACMGVGLHLVFLAARSLWISILLHTLNNEAAVLLTLYGSSDRMNPGAAIETAGVYAAAVALAASVGIAFWTSRARIVPDQGTLAEWLEKTPWRPEYPGVSAPPPGSGARLESGRVSRIALVLAIFSFAVLMYLIAF
jgi:membrane protease YdiL (CAAX protease family)